MWRRAALGLIVTALSLLPLNVPLRVAAAAIEPAAGMLLAPANRQAAWLNLQAPRPQRLTTLQAPSYVADVSVGPTGEAAIAVEMPFQELGAIGGDVLRLDTTSGATAPLVTRADDGESLGAPAWSADGAQLFVQREDRRSTPIAYPGVATVRFVSRIELVQADGTGRQLVREDARLPAPSPDGTQLAYVRSSPQGSALMLATLGGDPADDRELIPAGAFNDINYPRISPKGDTLAFVVSVPFGAAQPSGPWFEPSIASAHGFPWNVWLIGIDGANVRLLAEVGADDASVAWSPDGSQVFVYGGAGSFIVDAQTQEIASFPYLSGYGAVAWLP